MLRRILVTLFVSGALTLTMSSASWSFDGVRKGFVVGGGLGVSPVSHWELDGTPVTEDEVGVGLNLLIGYGWDERNLLVYEGNITSYKSSEFSSLGSFFGLGDQTIAQGFNGVAWYHYYGESGKSFLTLVGLGFYVFDVESFDANDPGVGILLGVGYEFARHVQVTLSVGAGSTSSGGADFKHSHINVLVSAVAF